MASVKEPGYFSPAVTRGRSGIRRGQTTREWYERLWKHCEPGALRGEASTAYFHDPDTAGMLRRASPGARVVIMLRDPVVRMYSHYLHDLRSRRLPPFERMVDGGHARFRHYLDVSRYAAHVERFRTTFPPEQVHVLLLEDLAAAPERTFTEVLRFLGREAPIASAYLGTTINASEATRSRIVNKLFAWRPLPLPALDATWQRLTTHVYRLNSRPVTSSLSDELRRRLVPLVTDDVDRLEALLGRRLPDWKR